MVMFSDTIDIFMIFQRDAQFIRTHNTLSQYLLWSSVNAIILDPEKNVDVNNSAPRTK